MQRLSANVTYAEGIASNTAKLKGIPNVPDKDTLENMKAWCEKIFEPTRKALGNKPIHVSNFYRAPALNVAIGGSLTSQHSKGEAGDIDGDVYGAPSNKEIFEFIRDNLVFDQLIIEGIQDGKMAWVHCSYKRKGGNRKQILFMYKDAKGKTVYENYAYPRYKKLVK